jgi:alpha-tubulin suppressor-like RCC1 family protein
MAVAAGRYFTCALSGDGLVRCWGLDDVGELGNGRIQGSLTPVVIPGLVDVASIAASVTSGNACAVTKAGALYCWGSNYQGQLGTGQYQVTKTATPVPVQGLYSGVRSVAIGNSSACAVTLAGAVLCWGDNSHGQLGTGDLTVGVDSPGPVAVPGLASDVVGVAAGDGYACALRTDGTALCWGYNIVGQLTGTDGDQHSPRPITGLTDIAAIVAGEATTCALTRAGGAFCWGDAPLGDGLSGDRTVPQPVRGLGNSVRGVSSGGTERCAVTNSGVVTCWSEATNTIPRPV